MVKGQGRRAGSGREAGRGVAGFGYCLMRVVVGAGMEGSRGWFSLVGSKG